jgi:hypothetical protein
MKLERITRTFDIERNVTETRILVPSKDAGNGLKPGEFRCHGRIVSPPQTSIHPRVVKGRTVHAKVNTAKAVRT